MLATSLVKTSFYIALKVLKNGPFYVLLVSKLILFFYFIVQWHLNPVSHACWVSTQSPNYLLGPLQINSKTKLHVSSKGLKKFNLNIFKIETGSHFQEMPDWNSKLDFRTKK